MASAAIAASAAKSGASAPTASAAASAASGAKASPPMSYRASVESWRREREEDLRSEEGWLTVAGLFWLKEGDNSFGTDPGSAIVLPAGSAPAHAGVFHFKDGKVVIRVEGGAPVLLDGKAVHAQEIKEDAAKGGPDKLTLNALTMYVIKRGDRYGIRLKDKNSKNRTEFAGLSWFPISESYKVLADWVPYDPPHKIPIANVLGQTEDQSCPGYASFTLNGTAIKLEPLGEPGKELSFIIRDGTSGKETYGAGRFLDTDGPKDGKLLIDFNKAYSPPCAFTEFATCPLPPKQNQMAVRIEAGEKYASAVGHGTAGSKPKQP